MEKAHKAAWDGLKNSILAIEDQLQTILKEDQQIKSNYKLLITIPGIGHLTAFYIHLLYKQLHHKAQWQATGILCRRGAI